MAESLYERLGGTEGINRIASDLVDTHMGKPRISPRYANSDLKKVNHGAATFFRAGTGGPNNYDGKDMVSTHSGMNISGEEFLAVLDDSLKALDMNGVGQREKEEVLYILYSMKPEIINL